MPPPTIWPARFTGTARRPATARYQYRCETAASCQSSHYESNAWTDWTATTRRQVLAATAAWAWRDTSRPGHGPRRRADGPADDGRHRRRARTLRGRRLRGNAGARRVRGRIRAGTPTKWAPSDGISPGLGNVWAGFQGSLAHSLPDGVARWSGRMLGYQWAHAAGDNPFVEGLATVNFSLSDNRVDVLFSEVRSRDRQRAVPDFGYRNLQAAADGTFAGFQSGSVEGAFFGPAHQEAAGSFHHNVARVTGKLRRPAPAGHRDPGGKRKPTAGLRALTALTFTPSTTGDSGAASSRKTSSAPLSTRPPGRKAGQPTMTSPSDALRERLPGTTR